MSIEGDQPSVPENPPPVSKDTQKAESLDPSIKTNMNKAKSKPAGEAAIGKGKHKGRPAEKVQLKELSKHELSVVSLVVSELFKNPKLVLSLGIFII